MDIIKDEIEIKKFYVVNSKLIVSIYEDGEEKTFMTTIRDFSPDGLFIAPVTSKGRKRQLANYESICLSIAKLGAIWLGESEVKRYERTPIEGYWIKYPKEIMKVQRRQFLRVDAMFNVTIKYYRNGTFYTSEEVSSFDISGTGIGVVSSEQLSKTLEMKVEFNYRGVPITVSAEVIYTKWNNEAELYYTGLRFLDIETEETDSLHKEIIQEQIAQRRNGTI